jgi:voltage-gated potassium channel
VIPARPTGDPPPGQTEAAAPRQHLQYERLTRVPLTVLGLLFLGVYAWPILDTDLHPFWRQLCEYAATGVWLVFAADFLIRITLTDDRRTFLKRNWLDLVLIALPMFRPLRALRAVTGLRIIGRSTAPFARRQVVGATAAAVAAAGAIAALAILEAERSSPDATIKNYGDALWWAISTITTVGYGDRYPTTAEGRMVAAGLMIAGIALLGVITASIASWFVERVRAVEDNEQQTNVTLQHLVAEIRELRLEVDRLSRAEPPNRNRQSNADGWSIGSYPAASTATDGGGVSTSSVPAQGRTGSP